jgi:hypothetical protein
MTASWRKLLGKICDFVFTVPLGVSFWPASHFEPLVIGLYFPLLPFSPWQLRHTRLLDGLAQQLSSLSGSSHYWGGDLLCQLLVHARQLAGMPPGVARDMLCGNR